MKLKAMLPVLLIAAALQAQQTNSQAAEQQHAAMMKRGDAGMGFSQEKTTHHFILRKNGGIIQVSANDPNDSGSKAAIQMHLSHVAKMFSEGNFTIPMFVHDTTPPGVPTMKKLRDEIHYHYEQTNTGAKIIIDTANPKALSAVHDFLRFQISEHRTGDSTEITDAAHHADTHP